MFKVNVGKELDSEKSKTEQGQHLVESAQKLLDGNHQRERDIMKKTGLGNSIIKAETAMGINLERTALEKEYGNKTYTQKEIKALALAYNLRFLSTLHFKGHVDTQIGYKLKDFFERNKLNDGDDAGRFYILAPEKAFNLQDRPKPEPIDPVLFYRPNRNDDKFIMVHQWGNDFTVARLISGFVNRNSFTYFLSMFIIFFCLTNIVTAYMFSYSIFWNAIVALVIGIAGAIAFTSIRTKGEWDEKHFNEERWNTNYNN